MTLFYKKIIFIIIFVFAAGFGLFVLVIFKNDTTKKDYLDFSLNKTSDNLTLNNISLKTQEVDKASIETVAEDLKIPWELVFLPDGSLLISQRPGMIKKINKNEDKLFFIEEVEHIGEGGLLGMALHPNYRKNHWIYLYLTTKGNRGLKNRVERYKFENDRLLEKTIILDNIPASTFHNGGRIAFGPDEMLYITTGDAQNPNLAQDINSLAGKILRLRDDGSIPSDNPFKNAVWSYGHRNPQGLAWDFQGRLFATEHGPSGNFLPNCCQDEINLIEKGKNYGWPKSFGDKVTNNTVAPFLHSGHNTWAPSGATFVKERLFFGALRGEALYEAVIKDNKIVALKEYFKGVFGRVRNVVLGPDGFLYILTSNTDGRGIAKLGDDKVIRINLQSF